ncbi:N-acetylmuramoyl-L-alanine amidase [Zymobacter palmae]|uniref:N-acetylmuramoyl-L-alanine amidase n=1 Tax=Zymobacter palmae TaxID=33074 RepID=A0A348HDW1_9GAMM|nr:N-acetylmuramoyl-L-alanine amidase [Zymobacter palmae]BBG29813.1 N-acetylmuramoyl-L-alanineamidase [Zymobacter palmae]
MRRRDFIGLISGVSLVPVYGRSAWGATAGPRIQRYGMSRHSSVTELVFDTTAPVMNASCFTLSNPPRLIIDLPGIAPPLPDTSALASGPITRVRSGVKGNGLRLVLDLQHDVKASLRAQPSGKVIVTLDGSAAARAAGQRVSSARPAIIAIDPGHGGKDPGAVSHDGAHEKLVAFSIAQQLFGLLQKNAAFKPRLIRTGDYFVPLHERILAASDVGAHMFISVHADAAPVSSAKGASVYILSEHGSSSAMARWMADSENSADQYASLRESALHRDDPRLSSMLLEMSMQGTIAASQNLGKLMLPELSHATALHQRHVNQAAFAVLKSPEIPSILVENGFMSNRDDCRRLVTSEHQRALAEALYNSVQSYFKRYPLPA